MPTNNNGILTRVFGGLLGGIAGYIIMFLLANTGIFPGAINWAGIGLFVGLLIGAFYDRLEDVLSN